MTIYDYGCVWIMLNITYFFKPSLLLFSVECFGKCEGQFRTSQTTNQTHKYMTL